MRYLIELARVIAEAGEATEGKDIFVNTMPAEVSRGVMLRPPLTGIEIDEGMRGHYSAEFLVIVRDPDAMTGYERAERISKILKARNLTKPGVHYTWLRPMELPVSYPRGDGDEIESVFPVQVGFAYT